MGIFLTQRIENLHCVKFSVVSLFIQVTLPLQLRARAHNSRWCSGRGCVLWGATVHLYEKGGETEGVEDRREKGRIEREEGRGGTEGVRR